MPTPTPRVQHPPFQPAWAIDTAAELRTAMEAPHKSEQLLDAIVRALYVRWLLNDHSASDAMVLLLLTEPALTDDHLGRLTHTLVNRNDAGLEPARIALCNHPLIGDDDLQYALWMAPAESLRAVAIATGRLIPNAMDWERRAFRRRGGKHFRPLAGASGRKIAELVARWETRTANEPALRSFICSASFLFSDQRVMFAAARGVTAAPRRCRQPAPTQNPPV